MASVHAQMISNVCQSLSCPVVPWATVLLPRGLWAHTAGVAATLGGQGTQWRYDFELVERQLYHMGLTEFKLIGMIASNAATHRTNIALLRLHVPAH